MNRTWMFTDTVDRKYRQKGIDAATADGNSVINLAVDFVVSASRSVGHGRLRAVVHEMMYLYMDTNDCLITRRGVRTFRERVKSRSKTIKAEALEEYFGTKFMVKPRST